MVAKSLDISSLLIMAAGLLLMYAIGESLIMRSFLLGREIFLKAGRLDFQIENLMQWIEWVFSQGLFILAAYVAPLMLVAVLSSWLQTGPVFSVFSLKPNFKKLNPVEGFKRIFSIRLLVEDEHKRYEGDPLVRQKQSAWDDGEKQLRRYQCDCTGGRKGQGSGGIYR